MVTEIAVCIGMVAAGLIGWIADRRLRDRRWGVCPLRTDRVCGCGIRNAKLVRLCAGDDARLPG